jgi:hypothetical protein
MEWHRENIATSGIINTLDPIKKSLFVNDFSDSSETDFLVPSRTRTSMDLGSNPANILPTLHEDPSEKDHHNH